MRRLFYSFTASLCLLMTAAVTSTAQNYSAPEVTMSKEKVKGADGKIYYSHIVLERQTLFSISKAYGVSLQEIYDANPNLNLETEGLKKDQILLIPIKGSSATVQAVQTEKKPENGNDLYITYKVKWYDDLDGIAEKYKVPKSAIMNFNGLTSEQLEKKQVLKIPTDYEKWEKPASAKTAGGASESETAAENNAGLATEKSISKADGNKEDNSLDGMFVREGNHDVNITLALPFNIQKGRNEQMFDFYSGALLAAEQFGKQGIKVTLNVYDVAGGITSVPQETFGNSDFVIGPVSPSDIKKAVIASNGSSWIVSPLDPKAEALVDTTSNAIQAPVSASRQIEDMIGWIRTDVDRNDKVIVMTEKNAKASSYNSSVLSSIKNSGMTFAQCTFGVNDVKSIMPIMEKALISTGCNRVVIASDNKTFVTEAVKNLYLVANSKKLDIKLYATAKLKSFEGDGGISVEHLHALDMHLCGVYLADYGSSDVKRFIKSYRSLFNAEPGPSAFQGYDLLTAFSTLANKYGDRWERRLERVDLSGLQSDMKLVKTENGGYVNTAVRRMIYEPDFTLKYVR